MSDDYQRVETITGTPRQRRWTVERKLRIVEGESGNGRSCKPHFNRPLEELAKFFGFRAMQ